MKAFTVKKSGNGWAVYGYLGTLVESDFPSRQAAWDWIKINT